MLEQFNQRRYSFFDILVLPTVGLFDQLCKFCISYCGMLIEEVGVATKAPFIKSAFLSSIVKSCTVRLNQNAVELCMELLENLTIDLNWYSKCPIFEIVSY